jgi:protein TonB
MTERVVSLRLAVIKDGDRENQRLSRVAVVILISLIHAFVFFMAVRGTETIRPNAILPAPISVRWVESTGEADTTKAEPPQPAILKPAAPPRAHVVFPKKPLPQTIHRPSPQQNPFEGAGNPPAQAEAVPSVASSANAPATESSQDTGRDEAASAITAPHVDAAYLANPAPEYPAEARRMRQEGRVLLRVLVAADGHAQEVSLDHGCGSPQLDEAAAAAVRKWRFTPARRGDSAVDAWALIPILFKLRT